MRLFCLLGSLLVIMTGGVVAQESNAGEVALSEHRLQRGLIATGLLDSQVGNATAEEFKVAIGRFRTLVGSVRTGALNVAEGAQLIELEKKFDALSGSTEQRDDLTGISIELPSLLVPKVTRDPGSGNSGQTFYKSVDGKVLVYVFRFGLKAQTPQRLLRKVLAQAKNLTVTNISNSSKGFVLEGRSYDSLDQEMRFHRRVFVADGRVHGVFVRYYVTPPANFEVPAFLRPVLVVTPMGNDGTDDRTRAWGLLMQAAMNLTVSDFRLRNGWKEIVAEGCRKYRKPSAAYKDVRVIVATNRERGVEAADGEVDTLVNPDGLFSNEPATDNQLHYACMQISVPTDSEVGLTPQSQIQPTWYFTTRTVEQDDTKLFRIRHFRHLGSSGKNATGSRVLLRDRERVLADDEERALIYIHGYNTPFSSALFRLAQIATAIDYPGESICSAGHQRPVYQAMSLIWTPSSGQIGS